MPDYNGVTWKVNYGEISERNQFRVGYIGQQSFDGYFELAQLADLISVLSAVQGAPLGQLTKGSTVQARKASDGTVTRVIIEPRSDTFPQQIMSLGLDTLSDLIYALQLFQTAMSGAPIPDDWDGSYVRPIVWLDKKGQLQPPNNAISQAVIDSVAAKTAAETAQAAAEAVEANMGPGVAGGLATLDGSARLPEAQVPSRLMEGALSATFGAVTLITAYGAVGDGTTDDSAAFAAALAATPDYGTLWLPKGTYKFATPVSHTRTKVNIAGPGRINGKLIVGANGANYDFQGRSITDLQFTRGGTSTDPTVACIELRNVLNLRIENCSFRDAGAAIYCLTEYDTARNMIQGNLYNNVGYFFRSVTGSTPGGRDPAMQWRSIADIHIADNSGQATVAGIVCDSIDGIVVEGNTFFMSGFQNASPIKERNIQLGFSDWVVIQGNNLFEAGLEAIQLTDANHFTIKDNNIAWPGQRVASSAIVIAFSTRVFAIGDIGGGVISQFTKYVVEFAGTGTIDLKFVVIDHISIERDISSPPAQYYGGVALVTPYRVYVPSTINTNMPILPPATQHAFGLNLPDNHRGRLITQERWLSGTVKEQTLFNRVTTIDAGNPTKNLYEVRSADGSGNVHFAGIVNLYFTPASGGTTKSAFYQLIIGKTPNTVIACTVIASGGNTTGAAADDPSFTFDVFNSSGTYYLRATRVGSTALAVNYTGWASGPLQLQ